MIGETTKTSRVLFVVQSRFISKAGTVGKWDDCLSRGDLYSAMRERDNCEAMWTGKNLDATDAMTAALSGLCSMLGQDMKNAGVQVELRIVKRSIQIEDELVDEGAPIFTKDKA